jgi:hypothetical protein
VANLSKQLFEFEARHVSELSEIELFGFLLWSGIKKDVFYEILKKSSGKSLSLGSTDQNKISLFERLKHLYNVCFRLKPIVFFTNSVNRNFKDEKGQFPEVLLEEFINNLDSKSSVVELNYQKHKIEKSSQLIRNGDVLNVLYSIVRLFLRLFKQGRRQADSIWDLISHLKEFSSIEYSELYNTILKFYSEYLVWNLIFKINGVKTIYVSDEMGSGKMAAAMALGITCVEFQHGIINRYKVDYYVTSEMNDFKGNYVRPSYIVVIGQFWKNLLEETGFWNSNEVVVLGSYKMSTYQHELQSKRSNSCLVLSQWMFVDNIVTVLSELLLLNPDYKFQIKPHPGDSASTLDKYRDLAYSHENLELLDQYSHTQQCLKTSEFALACNSYALIEALGLNCKVVSISADLYPKGIHSVIDASLETIIPVVDNARQASEQLSKLKSKQIDGSLYFEPNYGQNVKRFLNEIV